LEATVNELIGSDTGTVLGVRCTRKSVASNGLEVLEILEVGSLLENLTQF
jgi:hypothetical protein